jgi:hypothetical protein
MISMFYSTAGSTFLYRECRSTKVVTVAGAGEQITFPMTGDGAVFNLGGPLANFYAKLFFFQAQGVNITRAQITKK